MTVTTGQSGTNGKPINKGTILKLSVDYIKELKEHVSDCKNKLKELEHLVEIAKQDNNHLLNTHYLNQTLTCDKKDTCYVIESLSL